MEEDSSDLDVEELAMITRKFKKTGNSSQGVSNAVSLTTL